MQPQLQIQPSTYVCILYRSRITPRVHKRDAAEMNGSTSSSARCRRLRPLFQFPAYLLLLALSSDFTAISGHSILVPLGLFDGERRSTREVGCHLHLNATAIQTTC